jgi:hypothetical protein
VLAIRAGLLGLALTDLTVWPLLRRDLDPDQTAAAIRELVDACL